MVGMVKKCPCCGALSDSDRLSCDRCGFQFKRSLQSASSGRTREGRPRIVASTPAGERGTMKQEGRLGDRTALWVLMTVLALVPITPWVSTWEGALSVPACNSEVLYGRYILLLAVAGSVVALTDLVVRDLRLKRAALLAVGAGAFLMTLADYLCVLGIISCCVPLATVLEPGLGMYLSFATSLAVVIVILLPEVRSPARRSRIRYAIRPGSPGSGP
jgi:hypothetical protein